MTFFKVQRSAYFPAQFFTYKITRICFRPFFFFQCLYISGCFVRPTKLNVSNPRRVLTNTSKRKWMLKRLFIVDDSIRDSMRCSLQSALWMIDGESILGTDLSKERFLDFENQSWMHFSVINIHESAAGGILLF